MIRKLLSVTLAFALLFSMSVTAFAGTDNSLATIGTLTIQGAVVVSDGTKSIDGTTTGGTPGSITIAAALTDAQPAVTDVANTTFAWAVVEDNLSNQSGESFGTGTVSLSDGDVFIVKVDYSNGDTGTAYYVYNVTLGSSEPPGETTVTGEGSTEYTKLEEYSVVLPTADSLDFTLDPLGLLAVDATAVGLETLVGGDIVAVDEAVIINNSAVDLAVTASLQVTGDVTTVAYTTDDETTYETVENAGGAENVLIYADPSGVNFVTGAEEFVSGGKGYIIGKGADTDLVFVLGKANYTVEKTGPESYEVLPVAETGNGTAIKISGKVNTQADWSDYTGGGASKTVGLSAVFSFAKATEPQKTADKETTIPGLISPGTDVKFVTLTPPAVGFIGEANPTVKTIAKSAIMDNQLSVAFNFGGKTITKITMPSGTALGSDQYSSGANAIVFSQSRTTALKGLSTATTYTITLSDTSTYALSFTIS
jgi:hypothetical protein